MNNYVCVGCGVQFGETGFAPPACPICNDERQFINWDGQQWTTLERLRASHRNRVEEEDGKLFGIGTDPSFAIGQRALLVQSPGGNLLWDCVTLLDKGTVARVTELGGIRAIAISHPHFYGAMIEWSRAFQEVPIFLHAADRRWVMRDDPRIHYWDSPTHPLWDGMTLIQCGGHFAGASVLHWPAGAGARGALLTSDTVTVVQDRRYLSFMRSYPNIIPLSASAVTRITGALAPFPFETIYGGWWRHTVLADGKGALQRSAERYLRALSPESRES